MKSLIEKYKPEKLQNIPQDLTELIKLVKNKENILIHGQTGSCKTSSIYALAQEYDYEILELNASDFRNKDNVEKIVGENSKQLSLFNKQKIILIDEIEGLSGNEDRGGMQALAKLLETTKFPLIMTTNNINNAKIKEIKKKINIIEFKPVLNKNVENILKNICQNEGFIYDENSMRRIAINSCGDLRGAINDLQSSVVDGKVNTENSAERDYEITINNALNTIFKSRSLKSYNILEHLNVDLDEVLLWIDENLPIELENIDDLENAYINLSKSDIFKARINRWQYWRFMHYQNILLCGGVSLSKNNTKTKNNAYKRPMLPLKIWQANMRNSKKNSIVHKLAAVIHTDKRNIIKNFHYYKQLLKNPLITKELKLDEEEVAYLNK